VVPFFILSGGWLGGVAVTTTAVRFDGLAFGGETKVDGRDRDAAKSASAWPVTSPHP